MIGWKSCYILLSVYLLRHDFLIFLLNPLFFLVAGLTLILGILFCQGRAPKARPTSKPSVFHIISVAFSLVAHAVFNG